MVHMLVFTPTREIAHLQAGASYSSIWPERTQQLADVPQRFVSTASVLVDTRRMKRIRQRFQTYLTTSPVHLQQKQRLLLHSICEEQVAGKIYTSGPVIIKQTSRFRSYRGNSTPHRYCFPAEAIVTNRWQRWPGVNTYYLSLTTTPEVLYKNVHERDRRLIIDKR